MPEEKIKDKVSVLVGNYKTEIGYYESMSAKLQEEFEIINNGSNLSAALKVMSEKNLIMSKISSIETINNPLNADYNSAKTSLNYSSKELDKVLIKLSFLIEGLIVLQKRNEDLLLSSMDTLKIKMNNVKKSGMIVSRYGKHNEEPIYVEKMI